MCELAKVTVLKQLFKIHYCGYSGGVAAYVIRSFHVPNRAENTQQQGPGNIRIHTTRITTMMYLKQLFQHCNFSKLTHSTLPDDGDHTEMS